jgi:hypothetical protein
MSPKMSPPLDTVPARKGTAGMQDGHMFNASCAIVDRSRRNSTMGERKFFTDRPGPGGASAFGHRKLLKKQPLEVV